MSSAAGRDRRLVSISRRADDDFVFVFISVFVSGGVETKTAAGSPPVLATGANRDFFLVVVVVIVVVVVVVVVVGVVAETFVVEDGTTGPRLLRRVGSEESGDDDRR